MFLSAKVISFKKCNGVISLWKLQSSKITVIVHEHFFLQEESFRKWVSITEVFVCEHSQSEATNKAR